MRSAERLTGEVMTSSEGQSPWKTPARDTCWKAWGDGMEENVPWATAEQEDRLKICHVYSGAFGGECGEEGLKCKFLNGTNLNLTTEMPES